MGRDLVSASPFPLFNMSSSILVLFSIPFVLPVIADYSLECEKGFRMSGIRRAPSYYGSGLGTLSIDCERMASLKSTSCTSQPSIPRCDGELEGCTGSQWIGGIRVYEVENASKAVLLDPLCCSSSEVRVVPGSCIHDLMNDATHVFDHSIVSDLMYRGMQCWHQYEQKNNTLVDMIWKMETCAFESDMYPPIDTDPECEECRCECGIEQCSTGERPIKVIHKKKTADCECECTCSFKCL